MYTVTAKIVRPTTTVSFYIMTDDMVSNEVKAYWVETYKSTGKCLNVDVTESANQLEMINIIYWKDHDSYMEYKNDPFLNQQLFTPRNGYYSDHGITYTIISEDAT